MLAARPPHLLRSSPGNEALTGCRKGSGVGVVTALLAGTLSLFACSGSSTGLTTGSLSVTTSTTGQDLDPDGYTLSVDGGQASAIGVNETDTLPYLAAGSHDINLTGVRANCQVSGSDPRTVSVDADATASMTFDVACEHALIDQIAFQTNQDGNMEIYVMHPDGSDPVRLTTNPAYDGDAAISPDGTKIAFGRLGTGSTGGIYVMDADGSNLVRLSNDPANDYDPVWSPDGSKIAFDTNRDGNMEIYVMDADGSNPLRLTNNPANDYDPAWSPDGSKIAFDTNRDTNTEIYEIYVMNADGSDPVNLTNDLAVDDEEPAWSPDGSKIAFDHVSWNSSADFAIYVMNADGSNPVRLTTGTQGEVGSPTWSPDGARIAFYGTGGNGVADIWVMDADGSNRVDITMDAAAEFAPSWSPVQ